LAVVVVVVAVLVDVVVDVDVVDVVVVGHTSNVVITSNVIQYSLD